jgi:hypothetical protein
MSLPALLAHASALALLGQAPAPAPPGTCAACPQQTYARPVAWWAIPSDAVGWTMVRVGGGCARPRLAEPPTPAEGTWGWDYVGGWLKHHVILGWWHGCRNQGGSGAYQSDGPSLNHGEETLRPRHD